MGSRGAVEVLGTESLIDVESPSELLDDLLKGDELIVDECERLNLSYSNLSLINYSTTEQMRLLVTSLTSSRTSSNLSLALFRLPHSSIFYT